MLLTRPSSSRIQWGTDSWPKRTQIQMGPKEAVSFYLLQMLLAVCSKIFSDDSFQTILRFSTGIQYRYFWFTQWTILSALINHRWFGIWFFLYYVFNLLYISQFRKNHIPYIWIWLESYEVMAKYAPLLSRYLTPFIKQSGMACEKRWLIIWPFCDNCHTWKLMNHN